VFLIGEIAGVEVVEQGLPLFGAEEILALVRALGLGLLVVPLGDLRVQIAFAPGLVEFADARGALHLAHHEVHALHVAFGERLLVEQEGDARFEPVLDHRDRRVLVPALAALPRGERPVFDAQFGGDLGELPSAMVERAGLPALGARHLPGRRRGVVVRVGFVRLVHGHSHALPNAAPVALLAG
jgi:hypothetical protein